MNLNRDYIKADTPEMRAWLKIFNTWNPDFHIDNHVTDGSDFQYDVTWDMARNTRYRRARGFLGARAVRARTGQTHGGGRARGSALRRAAQCRRPARILYGGVLAALLAPL